MPFVYPSAAILAAAVLSVPSTALACSVCGCGDPLVVAGDAMPVSGNFRFALEGEYLSVTAASDDDLAAQVPLTRKAWSLTGGTTAEEATPLGLGDIDLGARWFLWQSTNMGAGRRQSFALTAGTSLPTGPDDAVDAADVRID